MYLTLSIKKLNGFFITYNSLYYVFVGQRKCQYSSFLQFSLKHCLLNSKLSVIFLDIHLNHCFLIFSLFLHECIMCFIYYTVIITMVKKCFKLLDLFTLFTQLCRIKNIHQTDHKIIKQVLQMNTFLIIIIGVSIHVPTCY